MESSPAAVRSSKAYYQARAQRLQEELERTQEALATQERDTKIWQAQASKLMEAWTNSEARADAATAAATATKAAATVKLPASASAVSTSPEDGQQLRNTRRPVHQSERRKARDRPAWEPQTYSPADKSAALDRNRGDTTSTDNEVSSTAARLQLATKREVELDAKAERLRQFERALQRRDSALRRREQDAVVAAAKLEEIAREVAIREQKVLSCSRAPSTHQLAGARGSRSEHVQQVSQGCRSTTQVIQTGDDARNQGCMNGTKRRLAVASDVMSQELDCKRRLRVQAKSGTHAAVASPRVSPGGKPTGGTSSEARHTWRP